MSSSEYKYVSHSKGTQSDQSSVSNFHRYVPLVLNKIYV